jgi:hypothetical protein
MARRLRGFIFNPIGNSVEIKLTKACLDSFPRTGSQDDAVDEWVEKLRPYLDTIPADVIKAYLKSTGGWEEEELTDPEANLRRYLWLAVGNCLEQKAQGEKNYLWTYMEP